MNRNKHISIVGFVILVLILVLSLSPTKPRATTFHSAEEQQYFSMVAAHGIVDSALIFPTAASCAGCHGPDPMQNAYIDNEGNDVNLFDDWQTSLMANSAKDPFWRAKVSHEVATFPQHQVDTEDKCTSCHAPMGHYTKRIRNQGKYGIHDLLVDTVGMDGVSCGACHQMSEQDLGNLFSGKLNYDTTRVMYGPFEFPFAPPMRDFVGFTPEYSEHIIDEGLCAGCHTLVTNSYNTDGSLSENFFAEQATYHEWLNSAYALGEGKQTCQNCHIPRIEDSIVISANYAFLEGRSPFGLHELVGGNVTMLRLMKENKDALGIKATDAAFDATIAATEDMLQRRSLDLEMNVALGQSSDSLLIDVKVTNLAGHKFPSGYPSRRAVLQFSVVASTGDTLFQSGTFDDQWEVAGLDPEFEPHYNRIENESQVQIYEFVTGDSDGKFTTLLEQAFAGLKDNRLPPLGFKKDHSTYDTVTIVGAALMDTNFNISDSGFEGTGSDMIQYHIPLNGYSGTVDIHAAMVYQPLPPRWMAPMFATQTDEIDTFKSMFDANDNEPVYMVRDTIANLLVNSTSTIQLVEQLVSIFPNPTADGKIIIQSENAIKHIQCVSNAGLSIPLSLDGEQTTLPDPAGTYYLHITFDDETRIIKKVVRL